MRAVRAKVEGRRRVSSGNPEDLLRSALEKIVFFECRVSQLEGELEAARALATREKESSAVARTREVAFESQLSRERSETAELRSRTSELAERVRLLETERGRLLSGMVEQARLSSTPEKASEVDGPDLAGFIAELRAEIERLQRWKAAAEKGGITLDEDGAGAPVAERLRGTAPKVPDMAARFEKEGRLGMQPADAASLQGALSTRAERSLYASSLDDLASPEADRRRRAAECLGALGSKAAAPLVAAAVGRERQPEVKVALLAALAALREPSTTEIALRQCDDQSPAVRAAALETAAALRPDGVTARLAAALADRSALVRRRAVLLLGFARGQEAEDALAGALADENPGVARAAAMALSGRPSSRAQAALTRALDHREPSVRRAAAQTVSRWAGEPLDAAAPPGERRRTARRITEKLATVDAGVLREAVVAAAASSAPSRAMAGAARGVRREPEGPPAPAGGPSPVPAENATSTPPGNPTPAEAPTGTGAVVPAVMTSPSAIAGSVQGPTPSAATAALARVRTAVAVVDAAVGTGPVEESIIGEVRAALRGCSAEELFRLVPADPADIEAALNALVARGTLARRGARFFGS